MEISPPLDVVRLASITQTLPSVLCVRWGKVHTTVLNQYSESLDLITPHIKGKKRFECTSAVSVIGLHYIQSAKNHSEESACAISRL